MKSGSDTHDQIREIAWMHYIAGLTQSEIAQRRGLSKMRVHRLVQAAHEMGIVKFFVDATPADCVALETELIAAYGLRSCTVVPDAGLPATMAGAMPAVASAGARFLHGRLESTEKLVFGIGAGRTMSEVVRALPRIRRRKAEFLSVTGDFAALSAANPFEVIHLLIDKTGGTGYAFTAPLIVDTPEDRALFLRQRSIQTSFHRLRSADLIVLGLGHIGPGSFFQSFDLLSDGEQAELARGGVVADLAGNLLDADGQFVDSGIAQRMLGMDRALLQDREVVAICAGLEKWQAARAALRSGHLTGLITSRGLAEKVLGAV